MAKLTAEEFIKKWTEDKKISEDDDVIIEFMEDATDSIQTSEGESEEVVKMRADYEKLSADYADLKDRYKERFLTSDVKIEEKKEEKKEEEPEEQELIDVKEI